MKTDAFDILQRKSWWEIAEEVKKLELPELCELIKASCDVSFQLNRKRLCHIVLAFAY